MRYLNFLLVIFLTACGQPDAPAPAAPTEVSGKPVVFTVNYPLAWAAEQLAGDSVEVVFPAPPGIDPAFWEPDLETIAAYQQADLILLNGAGYAHWTSRVSLPQNALVDTSAALADRLITVASGPVHSHGPEGEHSHGETAFTTWLDLDLFSQQMASIAAALKVLLPKAADDIDRRANALKLELTTLDTRLSDIGKALDGKPVLFSHPVFQYLENAYSFNGHSLHWEPDKPPTEQQWRELRGLLEAVNAGLMIWEGQPLPEVQERLLDMGVTVVVFPPQGNRSTEGGFLELMETSATELELAIERLNGA